MYHGLRDASLLQFLCLTGVLLCGRPIIIALSSLLISRPLPLFVAFLLECPPLGTLLGLLLLLRDGGPFSECVMSLFDMEPDGLLHGLLRPEILRRARGTLESAIDIHGALIDADDAAAGIPLAAGDACVGRHRAVHDAYATSQIIAAAAMTCFVRRHGRIEAVVRSIWDPNDMIGSGEPSILLRQFIGALLLLLQLLVHVPLGASGDRQPVNPSLAGLPADSAEVARFRAHGDLALEARQMEEVLAAIHAGQLPHLAFAVLAARQLPLVARLLDVGAADPAVVALLLLGVAVAAYTKKERVGLALVEA